MRLVVDASVVVKLVFAESDSLLAQAAYERHELIAPALLIPETVNAVWRRRRIEQFSVDAAMAKIAALADLEVSLAEMQPLAVRAGEFALALDHPAYDCFYLALAEASAFPLLTADNAFVGKIEKAQVAAVQIVRLADGERLQ